MLGVGGTTLLSSPSQYQQALAKPARRKLALLIGINTYPERALTPGMAQDIALHGCLTDVELQRQLLVHRFGFQPGDILTLINQEATRSGILTAIDEHLVQRAQPEDVVLLHFSGYGSQVRVLSGSTDPTAGEVWPAWVPSDGHLPSDDNPALGDILEAEVIARLQELSTPNLTTVIDAGSQDAGYLRWGNSRVRSRPTVPTGVLPTDTNLGANIAPLLPGNPPSLNAPWPGLVLRAAAPGRLVLESQWDGFSAGVFTYALTQSLWETNPAPTAQSLLQRTSLRLQRWVGIDQLPAISDRLPLRSGAGAYGGLPHLANAEGAVITLGEERPLTVWLGGVPPLVLRYLQPGSKLIASPAAPAPAHPLRLESRNGLRGVVKPLTDTPSTSLAQLPLHEQVRRLPQTIDLVVALDNQLKRVERVDATSALAGIPLVTSVAAGEKAADCLFGRLPTGPAPTLPATLASSIPPVTGESMAKTTDQALESSYGLFAPNRTLLPGTMLAKDEAVKTAVNRLTPYLKTLLALKLVRLTENAAASQLPVAALLQTVQPKPKPLLVQTTRRASRPWPLAIRQAQKALVTSDPLLLPRDSRLGYQLVNGSDQPLHLLWVSFDSRGECTALITLTQPNPEDGADAPLRALPLGPGQLVSLPEDGAGWAMPGAATWVEAYVVLSTEPLDHCLSALGSDPPALITGFRPVAQPLKLAQALLQDLSSTPATEGKPTPTDTYDLAHDRWATLSFRYTII
jgi:hypothetical protein